MNDYEQVVFLTVAILMLLILMVCFVVNLLSMKSISVINKPAEVQRREEQDLYSDNSSSYYSVGDIMSDDGSSDGISYCSVKEMVDNDGEYSISSGSLMEDETLVDDDIDDVFCRKHFSEPLLQGR